jgi:tetratricopeptide (TPR) repeat protein
VVLIGTVAAFSWRLAQERDLARLAAERAEREAATATAINQFLNEDLLQRANPYQEARRDLTVREALEQASLTVDERFADQPAVAASLHWTLANSLLGVGDAARAESQIEQALALDQAAAIFDSEQRLELRIDHAAIQSEQTRFDAALSLLEDVQSEAKRVFGHDSPSDLRASFGIAQVLLNANRPEAFLNANQDLLKRLEDSPLALSAMHISSLTADADIAARLGRFERADASIARALSLSQSLPPRQQHLYLSALQVSALLSRQRGDFVQAVALQRQVSALRELRFGRQHPVTLQANNELASILQDAKQYEEAERLFREVLGVRDQSLGLGNTLTRNSLNNLGLVLSLQGKLDEAGLHYRRALEAERTLLGDDALDVLILAHNFAGLLRAQGKLDEAIAMARDTVARAERTLSADRAEPALFRVGLAHSLLKRGDRAAALEQYGFAHRRLSRVYGDDNPKVKRIEEMRAEALKTP